MLCDSILQVAQSASYTAPADFKNCIYAVQHDHVADPQRLFTEDYSIKKANAVVK